MSKRTGNTKPNNQVRSQKMSEAGEEKTIALEAISEVLSGLMANAAQGGDPGLVQGVKNVRELTRVQKSKGAKPVPGTGCWAQGLMAFRRYQKNLNLAFVGGDAPAFFMSLDKLILLVERMHDPKRQTVILQNCSEDSESENARGQVLAKFNMGYPCLQVNWGDKGIVIEGEDEISKRVYYYVNPDELMLYYLAAKAQMKGGSQLEELLIANEGLRKYNIPTNPLDPGAE